jgi:hypothetical protein
MRSRLYAVVSFLLFLVVAQLVSGGLEWILVRKLHLIVPMGRAWEPSFFVFWEGAGVVGALVATWALARLSGRGFAELGYGTGGLWRELLAGGAMGFIVVTGLVIIATALGAYTAGHLMTSPADTTGNAIAWLLAMAGTSLAGEMTLHGAGLFALARATGFWPAALILSLVAAALGLGSSASGLNYAGAINALGISLLSCYAIQRTGAIWFACGLHALLDYTSLFIFGSPSRGNQGGEPILTRLFTGGFNGPTWLTGSSAGIESSWLMLPVLGAAFAVYWYVVRGTTRGVTGAEAAAGH